MLVKFKVLRGDEVSGWRAYGFVFYRLIVGFFVSDTHFMMGATFRKVNEQEYAGNNPEILY